MSQAAKTIVPRWFRAIEALLVATLGRWIEKVDGVRPATNSNLTTLSQRFTGGPSPAISLRSTTHDHTCDECHRGQYDSGEFRVVNEHASLPLGEKRGTKQKT